MRILKGSKRKKNVIIMQMRTALKHKQNKSIKVIDYIYPLTKLSKKQYDVSDHINLSGLNPLKGPRFISLSNIYISKKGIIVAGLKEGIEPNPYEKKILLKAGVKAYCYKLVSAVILAASRGQKVRAIGVVKKT